MSREACRAAAGVQDIAPQVNDFLAAFSSVRLLLVGDLLADHYLYGETERVSREAPVLIVRHELDDVKLGRRGNAAANARALGAKVTAVGVIGVGSPSAENGAPVRRPGHPSSGGAAPGLVTETRTRILAGGVSTTRQQMLRIDRGASGALARAGPRGAGEPRRPRPARADVVMVSDYAAGVLGDETRAALRRGRAERPVCVDSRFAARLDDRLHRLQAQRARARGAHWPAGEPEAELPRPASWRSGSSAAGASGHPRTSRHVAVRRGPRPELIPVHGADAAVDVTGAGDTVGATFAVALGAGASPLEAARPRQRRRGVGGAEARHRHGARRGEAGPGAEPTVSKRVRSRRPPARGPAGGRRAAQSRWPTACSTSCMWARALPRGREGPGRRLVVAVNSDASTRAFKGPRAARHSPGGARRAARRARLQRSWCCSSTSPTCGG